MTKYNTICLIVAAGSGERLKSSTPKQYLPLAGKAILRRSAEIFLNHPQVDAVCVVYNPEHQGLYDKAVGDLLLLPPVKGGNWRQESVHLGLLSIAQYSPKKVLIHDAARPLVDTRIISDTVNALDNVNAVIPAIPVDDTIKTCENGKVINTVPREKLMRAQTPQGFVYKEILAEYSNIQDSKMFTDDSSVFEYQNKEVSIIQGSAINIKITTEIDLKLAEVLYVTQL